MDTASSEESDGGETSHKLAVIVRTDLGMSAGKLASQVGHGVAESFTGGKADMLRLWQEDGGMIIVLQVASESSLADLQAAAKQKGIITRPIFDYGLTEIANGTWTALAVGPDEVARVDSVSGGLELLRETREECDLRRRNSDLEKQLQELSGHTEALASRLQTHMRGAAQAVTSPAATPICGEVWLVRDLSANPIADACRAVVPEMFEQWCWEGDRTCLPSKWEQAVRECCNGQVASDALRPWEASGFDEQGIFFVTSRSETCGIAVALPGTDAADGVIASWGVQSSYRRRGLGRCLLRLCLQRHAELGRSRVFLAVDPSRSPEAFQLLQTEGFVPAR